MLSCWSRRIQDVLKKFQDEPKTSCEHGQKQDVLKPIRRLKAHQTSCKISRSLVRRWLWLVLQWLPSARAMNVRTRVDTNQPQQHENTPIGFSCTSAGRGWDHQLSLRGGPGRFCGGPHTVCIWSCVFRALQSQCRIRNPHIETAAGQTAGCHGPVLRVDISTPGVGALRASPLAAPQPGAPTGRKA
jgi:hypothetical protein